jgi:ribosomal protein S18 acetylase RimI-like enzyme
MTLLVPMRPEAFPAFFEAAVSGYAADNIASGRWLEHEAEQLARAETERLLPNGVATPDNHVLEILATSSGPCVGFLWFGALARGNRRVAFLYQLFVYPAFRRRGHALAALAALEAFALELGLSGVALNVFGSNAEAQALYRAAGYAVTSISMHRNALRNVAA